MTLDELVAALAATGTDGDYAVDLPENWAQGRTAYGGITAALGLATAREAMPDLPPLRSAQVAFVGPMSGRIRFRPELLRRGRSASFVRVDGFSEQGIAAAMTFVFADDRESAVSKPPPGEPAETGEVINVPEFLRFARNFDHWFAAGATHYLDRFIRLKEPSDVHPEIELLSAGDLLPPPALFNLPQVVPLSTMNWHIDLMDTARRSADRRWRVKSEGEMHDHGLATQTMWMWDGEGRLVAKGRQLVALFG